MAGIPISSFTDPPEPGPNAESEAEPEAPDVPPSEVSMMVAVATDFITATIQEAGDKIAVAIVTAAALGEGDLKHSIPSALIAYNRALAAQREMDQAADFADTGGNDGEEQDE
jgi:hypothetical protein